MQKLRKPSAPVVVEVVEVKGYVVQQWGTRVLSIFHRRKPKLRFELGRGVQASKSNPDVKQGTLGWITQIRLPNSTPSSEHCVWVMFEKQSIPVAYKLEHLVLQR